MGFVWHALPQLQEILAALALVLITHVASILVNNSIHVLFNISGEA
jgi:hypothetical protein